MWHQCKVIAHYIDNQSAKDEKDSNPETPIAMRTFPIRPTLMMNGGVTLSFMPMFVLVHSV